MYLTEINPKTGLVDIANERDGVLAIKEFRELINNKKFGLECFTAVAFVADYETPIKHYSIDDRPRKAMENVTGERDKWVWKQPIIQAALVKYDALQYNPVLEEGKIHNQRKIKQLKKIQEAEAQDGKEYEAANGEKLIGQGASPSMFKTLENINANIKTYEESIQGKDLFEDSPSKGGYKLTRLEQLMNNKNSFYHKIR